MCTLRLKILLAFSKWRRSDRKSLDRSTLKCAEFSIAMHVVFASHSFPLDLFATIVEIAHKYCSCYRFAVECFVRLFSNFTCLFVFELKYKTHTKKNGEIFKSIALCMCCVYGWMSRGGKSLRFFKGCEIVCIELQRLKAQLCFVCCCSIIRWARRANNYKSNGEQSSTSTISTSIKRGSV